MIEIKEYDAVIFDMDGVLIDSEPLWKIAMEEVFHALGSTLKKEDFQKTVGLRIDEVVHFWNHHENWGISNESEIEEAIIVKMIELISKNAQPLSGVIETLTFLKNKGLKIGLATSSSSRLIKVVLAELNIARFFDFVHSAENEAYGKPHPAVYVKVAEVLNVSPTKCLVIEDSFNGVIAGIAAKMKVVCIPEKTHFPNQRLAVADFHFETMNDFLLEIQD
ncbi:MAG: hexitol phosphatase HxpB [Crocinitomicaceae bacterium]|nr:hexitol phosphatase HxpB [Crocinitomicaceae bacterium]MDP4761716.1 hexitol phosphatase HxpB [Crocinitomicaceae bacterium]